MKVASLSRRSLLAGGAALTVAGAARAEDAEVLIVGAGAAGIGAARELSRLGKRFVVSSRHASAPAVGSTRTMRWPAVRRRRGLHPFAETNPWSRIAEEAGVDPRGGHRLWSGSRAFRNGLPLDAEAAAGAGRSWARVSEAYDEIEERQDVSLAQALRDEEPEVRDLGRIQSQMAAGEDPEWVSTSDWQRLEGGQNRLVPGGYGALAAKTAEPLGVRQGVRVTAIDWSGQQVVATTSEGTIRARKAIVTVPIGILKAGDIRFTPSLPLDHARALDGLKMGALSKVALRFEKERFDYQPHQFLAEIGEPTRAITFETWPFDSDLVVATFGGDHARGLARQGEAAAVDQVLERFVKIAAAETRARPSAAACLVGWSEDPFAKGSYAVALPAGCVHARPWRGRWARRSGSPARRRRVSGR